MNENKFNGMDELQLGHSEPVARYGSELPSSQSAPKLSHKELHKHYTAAQLEIALIRAKSAQIDKRIEDLRAQALKLQADLAVKERHEP